MLGDACFYFPIGDAGDEALRSVFRPLAKLRKGIAGHSLQPDMYMLRMHGVSEGLRICFDSATAQYLLDPSRKDYGLDALAFEHLGMPMPAAGGGGEGAQLGFLADSGAENAKRGAACCATVDALMAPMRGELERQGLGRLFDEVEMPLAAVLADMEAEGFAVDSAELAGVGRALSDSISAARKLIYGLAGEEFNINSPTQLGVVLFEKLGLPSSKKTKTGYATGADILEKLRDRHEIIDAILAYRMLTKISGTYVDGLLPLVGEDGRIRAHFRQTVTATGRISCTEPNLQNIPIKQEQGRAIRKAFIPRSEGFLLVGADYSQIELRVLAHLTQDEALIEDFRQGADIHRRTAARVFGLAEEDVTQLQRNRAKAVNFGVIYGMSGFGLSEELGIARGEAESYIEEYFRAHGAVRRYMDAQIQSCREKGYVSTILGRRRGIPEIGASSYATRQLGERLAMNTPIQGSAADIIKLAMIDVAHSLKAEGLKSRLILQVHDELIIDTSKDELEAVKRLLKEKMETAYSLSVPLVADLRAGANWYELK
jgi:DNA polymerase-1